jgi:hypothetical protein
LGQLARDRGFADALLFEACEPSDAPISSSEHVQIVRASELIERLEAAALVRWESGKPLPDVDQYGLLRKLDDSLPALDSIGLRWLVPLSLNKLPHELEHLAQPADRLFERAVFRVFTSVFRFGGKRLGALETGMPLPDAVLRAPHASSTRFAALTDSKAARDGYRMNRADERAIIDYARDLSAGPGTDADPLAFVVVVSSSFPGSRRPHPYAARARRVHDQTGARLVYVRAADLLVLSVALEQDEAPPSVREAIDWFQIFDDGIVRLETLMSAYGAAVTPG